MTKSNNTTYNDALAEASKWIAREGGGDMTRLEKEELENLLIHDVDFQLAYLEISRSVEPLDSLSAQGGKELLSAVAPDLFSLAEEGAATTPTDQTKRRFTLPPFGWVASIAASFLMIGVLTLFSLQDGPMSISHQTAVGESRTIMLKDGSMITLNTDTQISVAMTGEERRILLEQGEAYFDVAKDKTRPFIVVVGDDIVRAVGTAFNIKRRDMVTNVMVTEGVVEVKKNPTNINALNKTAALSTPISLTVGEDLTADQEGVRTNTLTSEELEHQTSWRRGMLHFKRERLDSVIREVQYYVNKEIIIASDQASDIIVGGSLNTQNVSSFLTGLAVNFPVNVIERDSVIIISYENKRGEKLNTTERS